MQGEERDGQAGFSWRSFETHKERPEKVVVLGRISNENSLPPGIYIWLIFFDRNITPSHHHRTQTELSEIPFFSYSQINPAKIESSVEHILDRLKPVYLQVIVALLVYI